MNTNENDYKNPNESSNIVTTSMKSEHKMTNLSGFFSLQDDDGQFYDKDLSKTASYG